MDKNKVGVIIGNIALPTDASVGDHGGDIWAGV